MKLTLHSKAKFSGIGTASLFDLHGQIVTLKETIIYLDREDTTEISGSEVASTTAGPECPIGLDLGKVSQDLVTTITNPIEVNKGSEDSGEVLRELQEEYNKLIFQKHKVWCRSFVIPKDFVGLYFQVHNGSKFVLLKITEKIVGYRFGEFVPTRKVTVHKEAKKK